jgi:hypothetical protein
MSIYAGIVCICRYPYVSAGILNQYDLHTHAYWHIPAHSDIPTGTACQYVVDIFFRYLQIWHPLFLIPTDTYWQVYWCIRIKGYQLCSTSMAHISRKGFLFDLFTVSVYISFQISYMMSYPISYPIQHFPFMGSRLSQQWQISNV